MKNKGFTLIELLVVIAIIGILSSVVLLSLTNARTKAKDSTAQVQIASLRAQSAIYYDNANGTYLGFCGDSGTTAILTAAANANGGTTKCNDVATAWAAEVSVQSNTKFYCASDLKVATESATKGTATTCL